MGLRRKRYAFEEGKIGLRRRRDAFEKEERWV